MNFIWGCFIGVGTHFSPNCFFRDPQFGSYVVKTDMQKSFIDPGSSSRVVSLQGFILSHVCWRFKIGQLMSRLEKDKIVHEIHRSLTDIKIFCWQIL